MKLEFRPHLLLDRADIKEFFRQAQTIIINESIIKTRYQSHRHQTRGSTAAVPVGSLIQSRVSSDTLKAVRIQFVTSLNARFWFLPYKKRF